MTDLSIIVVNHNTETLLERCLRAVIDSKLSVEFEILVVDNASEDGSVAMIRTSFPQVKLIVNSENVGFARANNQAIQVSLGRHVLLLNSDAVPIGASITLMVTHLDSHPNVGVVGGKLLNSDGSFQGSYADFPTFWGELLLLTHLFPIFYPSCYPSHSAEESGKRCSADWVSGAFFMARQAALNDTGLLDKDFFMYSEEMELCFRMRLKGWEVHYLPDAQALHYAGGSYRRIPEQKRTHVYRGKWLFIKKHRGNIPAYIYGIAVKVLSVLKLSGWLVAGLSPNPGQRQRSKDNVASYMFLIRNF